jgi:hypothetical protein
MTITATDLAGRKEDRGRVAGSTKVQAPEMLEKAPCKLAPPFFTRLQEQGGSRARDLGKAPVASAEGEICRKNA